MGFNVSVIKLVFVASTVNLLFNSNSTQPILTLTQIDTTSMRKAWHLFEGGINLSKMGKLASVLVLRTRRLEYLNVSSHKKLFLHYHFVLQVKHNWKIKNQKFFLFAKQKFPTR
jgi:hypothetical protein